MGFYNGLSIANKLKFTGISTAVVAGVLSISFILVYQWFNEKNVMSNSNHTITSILTQNIAQAMLFNDTQSMKKTLSSLKYEKRVEEAYAMSDKWALLESYNRHEKTLDFIFKNVKPDTKQFWNNFKLYTVKPINIENKDIGSLVVISSLDEFKYDILKETLFFTLIAFLSILLTFKYSSILVRGILIPISKLNESTNLIIKTKALNTKVEVLGHDEVGELANNFNIMIEELSGMREQLIEEKNSYSYKADHDALTGLPNRALFSDRLELAISKAKRKKSTLGVFFLDLDYFKNINDTFGHDAGDEVLKIFARRIKDSIREGDTLARMGGDEFMIIVESEHEPQTSTHVAGKILSAMKEPVHLKSETVSIGSSIGISLYPQDAQDANGLVKNADIAMYEAKSSGRNCFRFYKAE